MSRSVFQLEFGGHLFGQIAEPGAHSLQRYALGEGSLRKVFETELPLLRASDPMSRCVPPIWG